MKISIGNVKFEMGEAHYGHIGHNDIHEKTDIDGVSLSLNNIELDVKVDELIKLITSQEVSSNDKDTDDIFKQILNETMNSFKNDTSAIFVKKPIDEKDKELLKSSEQLDHLIDELKLDRSHMQQKVYYALDELSKLPNHELKSLYRDLLFRFIK